MCVCVCVYVYSYLFSRAEEAAPKFPEKPDASEPLRAGAGCSRPDPAGGPPTQSGGDWPRPDPGGDPAPPCPSGRAVGGAASKLRLAILPMMEEPAL
jgi:hypothetical protein